MARERPKKHAREECGSKWCVLGLRGSVLWLRTPVKRARMLFKERATLCAFGVPKIDALQNHLHRGHFSSMISVKKWNWLPSQIFFDIALEAKHSDSHSQLGPENEMSSKIIDDTYTVHTELMQRNIENTDFKWDFGQEPGAKLADRYKCDS